MTRPADRTDSLAPLTGIVASRRRHRSGRRPAVPRCAHRLRLRRPAGHGGADRPDRRPRALRTHRDEQPAAARHLRPLGRGEGPAASAPRRGQPGQGGSRRRSSRSSLRTPTSMSTCQRLLPQAPERQRHVRRRCGARSGSPVNATLQAGYFILAARAAGLSADPMGGFDAEGSTATFWDGPLTPFFVVNIGHARRRRTFRAPRLSQHRVFRSPWLTTPLPHGAAHVAIVFSISSHVTQSRAPCRRGSTSRGRSTTSTTAEHPQTVPCSCACMGSADRW